MELKWYMGQIEVRVTNKNGTAMMIVYKNGYSWEVPYEDSLWGTKVAPFMSLKRAINWSLGHMRFNKKEDSYSISGLSYIWTK